MTSNFRALSTFTLVAFLGCAALALRSHAQNAARYYEDGVNAYFAGRACDAESLLSTAMQEDALNPLTYYFRGLCLLRQGRTAEARGDMWVGARLEAESNRRAVVGAALERVQGPTRLMLEEIRRDARRQVSSDAALVNTPAQPTNIALPQSRTFREGEMDVLRERTTVPLEELLRAGGPRAVAVPAEAPPPTPPQPAAPAEQPAPATDAANPFGDDAEKAAQPAEAPATPPAPPEPKPAPPVVPPQDEFPATPPATPPVSDENPFG